MAEGCPWCNTSPLLNVSSDIMSVFGQAGVDNVQTQNVMSPVPELRVSLHVHVTC